MNQPIDDLPGFIRGMLLAGVGAVMLNGVAFLVLWWCGVDSNGSW
jgi:hypothetical protein